MAAATVFRTAPTAIVVAAAAMGVTTPPAAMIVATLGVVAPVAIAPSLSD